VKHLRGAPELLANLFSLHPRRRGESIKCSLRSRSGSTLALVAMCTLLVIIALGAGFQLMIYLGSSQELKNSVDAGSLNVAMRAAEVRVPASAKSNYDDVADCSGRIGISNINRVWGKAYLVSANAQDIIANGNATGFVSKSSSESYTNATQIAENLFNALQSGASADVHFNQMTQNKPAKLLKANGEVSSSHDDEWTTACCYPGEESNLTFDPQALPKGIVPNQIEHNGQKFLQGYNAMSANGKTFCFTTFHQDEAPHLISLSTFDKAKNSAINSQVVPIPNSFKNGGSIIGKLSLHASAAAVANPMRTYQLQLPRAYFMVTFDNTATWTVQGRKLKTQKYGHGTGQVKGVSRIELKPPDEGLLTGYGTLGQEYNDLNLWSAIHALPGDKSVVEQKLLQRAREMRPGYTMVQLQKLLTKIPIPQATDDWSVYVYCNDGCNAAGQLPELSYATTFIDEEGFHAVGLPYFIPRQGAEVQAEGQAQQIAIEQSEIDYKNTNWSTILGPYPTDIHSTSESGTLFWQPGTGWQSNLGVLRIERQTTLIFTGKKPS
jgi:hypothetical protein